MIKNLVGLKAPEFPDGLQWLNSQPLKLADLRGDIVLIDFWTYSCVNCLRTLPHLRRWHKLYSGHNFYIIGVHTPEFDFEKRPENVEKAVWQLDLTYPIVLDPDYKVWNLFLNSFWPRKILVDSHGKIIYDHIGEGGYEVTEQLIQAEIKKISPNLFLPAVERAVGAGGICYPTTPEIYLGAKRGWVANAQERAAVKKTLFRDDGEHQLDAVYLEGFWQVEEEYLKPLLSLRQGPNHLLLKFKAMEVNLVLVNSSQKPQAVEVLLNGAPLTQDNKGLDVELVGGKSIINVQESRMYRVLDSKRYIKEGELEFFPQSGDILFYAFTFGACLP